MTDIGDFLTAHGWPAGLETAIADSAKQVAYRFIVVDNSRSMLNRDSYDVVKDGLQTKMYVTYTKMSSSWSYQLSC